jgi:hypothetical protein
MSNFSLYTVINPNEKEKTDAINSQRVTSDISAI